MSLYITDDSGKLHKIAGAGGGSGDNELPKKMLLYAYTVDNISLTIPNNTSTIIPFTQSQGLNVENKLTLFYWNPLIGYNLFHYH